MKNITNIIIAIILGLVVGVWAGRTVFAPAPQAIDQPAIVSLEEKFTEDFPNQKTGFSFDFLTKSNTGSVEVFKIADRVPLHRHAKENHILYVFKGTATGKIGDIEGEVKEGQLVIIPAGVPHALKNTGEEPLEFVLFSTPPFDPEDIEVLE